MRAAIEIIALWFLLSIPLGMAVGAWLRKQN